MLTDLRRQANDAAQAAWHRLCARYGQTGEWDPRLWREYRRLDSLVDMFDDRIRDMMADTEEPDGWGLPDIATADPGNHFAGMPR